MYLVIAEKPSVARSIANVIGAYKEQSGYLAGNDCVVSWCLGHLAEYEDPEYYDDRYKQWRFEDLPIIPEAWRMRVTPDKKQQYGVLKNLLKDSHHRFEYVVNACDAGREGELIFRRVYELAKCSLPVKRLWISSMEDKAILEGFAGLRDGSEYDDLAAASVCRAKSDWLLGINATRTLTTTYGRKLIVGRVKTPTLAMIVDRDAMISSFTKEQYYLVHIRKDGLDAVSDHFATKDKADSVADTCRGKDAVVSFVKSEQKTLSPPKLYDLTSLQRDANRLFGMTARETLETAQSLYETKLITYPRTDSRYITSDMEDTVISMIDRIRERIPFISFGGIAVDLSKVINDSKVSDHHAIIPTEELRNIDLSKLHDNERLILFLVATRVMSATGKPHKYTVTSASIRCSGYDFKAQCKTVDQLGWKAYEDAMKSYCKADKYDKEDHSCSAGDDDIAASDLPEVREGMIIPVVDSDISEHWTSPPKHYTEDSLLSAMERAGAKEMDDDVERKGLGTPATRAGTIEELIRQGYVVRKKKQLIATDEGKSLAALAPVYLKSATLTAEWENRLLAMERGAVDPNTFIDDVISQIVYLISECKEVLEDVRSLYRNQPGAGPREVGKCPVCGSSVFEGNKLFYCKSDECKFCLWKNTRYLEGMKKKMTAGMAEDLLRDGRTFVYGLYSRKKNRTFDAFLLMDASNGRPRFSLEFPEKTGNESAGAAANRGNPSGDDSVAASGDINAAAISTGGKGGGAGE